MTGFHAGEDTRKRAQIALALNREQTIAAQQEQQNAQRLGQFDKASEAQDKIDRLNAERQQHAMQLTGVAYGANERLEAAKAAAKAALYDKLKDNVRDSIKLALVADPTLGIETMHNKKRLADLEAQLFEVEYARYAKLAGLPAGAPAAAPTESKSDAPKWGAMKVNGK